MAETLDFQRSLYLPEAVRSAAEAYAELAKIEVTVDDNGVRLEISDPDPDLADRISDELANHALHETIVRTRSGE